MYYTKEALDSFVFDISRPIYIGIFPFRFKNSILV